MTAATMLAVGRTSAEFHLCFRRVSHLFRPHFRHVSAEIHILVGRISRQCQPIVSAEFHINPASPVGGHQLCFACRGSNKAPLVLSQFNLVLFEILAMFLALCQLSAHLAPASHAICRPFVHHRSTEVPGLCDLYIGTASTRGGHQA